MGQRGAGRRRLRCSSLALVSIIALAAGCSDGAAPKPSASSASTEPAPVPPSATPALTPGAGLAAEFQQFAQTLGANVGVVLVPVGDPAAPQVSLGTWTHGPAWSTIKVPLSVAALRESPSAGVTEAMKGA